MLYLLNEDVAGYIIRSKYNHETGNEQVRCKKVKTNLRIECHKPIGIKIDAQKSHMGGVLFEFNLTIPSSLLSRSLANKFYIGVKNMYLCCLCCQYFLDRFSTTVSILFIKLFFQDVIMPDYTKNSKTKLYESTDHAYVQTFGPTTFILFLNPNVCSLA